MIIEVDTDIDRSWIQGRNGNFNIDQIQVVGGNTGPVLIEGRGKSGRIINGGLAITREAMDEVCRKWLEGREA